MSDILESNKKVTFHAFGAGETEGSFQFTIHDRDDSCSFKYTEEEAKAKIFILKQEQREIDDQLRLAAESVRTQPQDPAALAASIMDRLKNLGGSISTLPTYQLRQVLASLVASATISMRTGEVEIDLRIPESAISDVKTAIETLSLRQTSPSPTLSQAQLSKSFVFARIDCQFYRESQKPCARCSRAA